MRSRRYETVFILPPDLEEGKRREILDRVDGVVEKGGGFRIKREDWGVRRFAHRVNHQSKGHYYLIDYAGSEKIVAELERHMRMIESVLRFLTVKTDDRVDLEAARREQAEEREKESAKEAAAKEKALEQEDVGLGDAGSPEAVEAASEIEDEKSLETEEETGDESGEGNEVEEEETNGERDRDL